MQLEGFVDPDMSERDFIDLCSNIYDSLHFCIIVEKTIVVVRKFDMNKFIFYITFPNNHGTKSANKKFVEDMTYFIQTVLEDHIPVGVDHSKKTYAILNV